MAPPRDEALLISHARQQRPLSSQGCCPSAVPERVDSRYPHDAELLNAGYHSLLKYHEVSESDAAWEAAVTALMSALAGSGNQHYYTALNPVATSTTKPQLVADARRFASLLLNHAVCAYPVDSQVPCALR